MYRVLIVDDEIPALRFLQTIIDKYAQDFKIVQSCTCGEDALIYLNNNEVDLLLTDIAMPNMNGIELSRKARTLQPNIHIIIITGYADFEYAKSAIQASVDDYILKPVSVSHMTEILSNMHNTLEAESTALVPSLFCALFSGQSYNERLAEQLYGNGQFYFAMIRWGNLGFSSGDLKATSVIPVKDVPFYVLYGRDEDEQLLFMSSVKNADEFRNTVKNYASGCKSAVTQTIILTRNGNSFSSLPDFFHRAANMMEQSVVIGRHQCITLSNNIPNLDASRHISNATLKKLEYFILDRNTRMIKDTFISLAANWEKTQLPQIYAHTMVLQLTHLTLSLKSAADISHDKTLRDVKNLLRYAASYGDLMAGLYTTLFDSNIERDKKLSTEELCTYAMNYIQEKYAQPISIQNVCSEIGISQTYLSRLLRRHANTSFNSYLTQCRINNAKDMIRKHPESPLRDIASCVGYDDYAYFSKVFHQMVGCTPSQWVTTIKK